MRYTNGPERWLRTRVPPGAVRADLARGDEMDANWLTNGLVQWLLTLGGIILVDIALSGDNALVIGAAASRLPARQRTIALLWGGIFAAVLRIGLTGIATELLLIPLLQTVGAAVILFIAMRMLAPEKEDDS